MSNSPRLHFWDLATPEPAYSCGTEPGQGSNDHVFGDHREPESVSRFAAAPRPCTACLSALLAGTP